MARDADERLLTVPEEEQSPQLYFPTGNEYVSLPDIDVSGAAASLNVLHMGSAGLVEFRGAPLIEPWIADDAGPESDAAASPHGGAPGPGPGGTGENDGAPRAAGAGNDAGASGAPGPAGMPEAAGAGPAWSRDAHWMPRWQWKRSDGLWLEGLIAAPPGNKGAVYRLRVENAGRQPRNLVVGFRGAWTHVDYTVYTSRPVEGSRHIFFDRWSGGPVLEVRPGAPLAALGFGLHPEPHVCQWTAGSGEYRDPRWTREPVNTAEGTIWWRLGRRIRLEPGGRAEVSLLAAANREADGARTTVVDLVRQGASALIDDTRRWLRERSINLAPGHGDLEAVANENLFFNYFYARGNTIDTEDRVLVTSRSPHYYVSAAFWARDSLLWSFPATLLLDPAAAREDLLAAFTRYMRHPGIHSLYMDGSLLYPGFELDELVAYLIALERYAGAGGRKDETILDHPAVLAGIDRILADLSRHRHGDIALYSTFLYPSDDPAHMPYTTYGNALAARSLRFASRVLTRRGHAHRAAELRMEAESVERAIRRHCVVPGPEGPMFAYAVDLEGGHVLYDEPPGSLQLLHYYGFCQEDDPVYRRTVEWIRSSHNPYYYPDVPFPGVGCPHAAHPFVMDLFNRLLSGLELEAADVLRRAPLDGGLACESFDRYTGQVVTGRHFATCSGFLGYALARTFGPPSPRLQTYEA